MRDGRIADPSKDSAKAASAGFRFNFVSKLTGASSLKTNLFFGRARNGFEKSQAAHSTVVDSIRYAHVIRYLARASDTRSPEGIAKNRDRRSREGELSRFFGNQNREETWLLRDDRPSVQRAPLAESCEMSSPLARRLTRLTARSVLSNVQTYCHV